MAVKFSSEAQKRFEWIVSRYPVREAAMLPTLHLAQTEFGHLSDDVMAYVGELLDLPATRVRDTASFYTMYKLKPTGKYHIQVCHTVSCALRGSKHVVEYLEKKCNVKCDHNGSISPDGKYSIIKVECLGSCGTAPMIQINDDYYEDLTKEKIDKILSELK